MSRSTGQSLNSCWQSHTLFGFFEAVNKNILIIIFLLFNDEKKTFKEYVNKDMIYKRFFLIEIRDKIDLKPDFFYLLAQWTSIETHSALSNSDKSFKSSIKFHQSSGN